MVLMNITMLDCVDLLAPQNMEFVFSVCAKYYLL